MNDDSAIQDAKLMINCSSKEPRCANQPTTQPKVKCRDIFGQVKKNRERKTQQCTYAESEHVMQRNACHNHDPPQQTPYGTKYQTKNPLSLAEKEKCMKNSLQTRDCPFFCLEHKKKMLSASPSLIKTVHTLQQQFIREPIHFLA
jgi:hypothetical protein